MDKTMHRKLEERLYRHFRRTRQLDRFEKALIATRLRINILEERIRNCNHTLENPLKSPSFDGMPGSGEPGNPIEQALMRAFEKMERELGRHYSRLTNLELSVERVHEEVELLGLIIEELVGQEKQIIDLRYNQGYTFRDMEAMLFSDHVSLHRTKDRILDWIGKELAEHEEMEAGTSDPCLPCEGNL